MIGAADVDGAFTTSVRTLMGAAERVAGHQAVLPAKIDGSKFGRFIIAPAPMQAPAAAAIKDIRIVPREGSARPQTGCKLRFGRNTKSRSARQSAAVS